MRRILRSRWSSGRRCALRPAARPTPHSPWPRARVCIRRSLPDAAFAVAARLLEMTLPPAFPIDNVQSIVNMKSMAHGGQVPLFGREWRSHRLEHGGALRRSKRKIARPISPRRAHHVVFCSSRARGPWSLRNRAHQQDVEQIVRAAARRHGVRIYRFANAGTHLHLLARPGSRAAFQAFLRVAGGLVARRVTGARKGRKVGRFWDDVVYSRVVAWGRDFAAVRAYVELNVEEAMGLRPYRRPTSVPAEARGPGPDPP